MTASDSTVASSCSAPSTPGGAWVHLACTAPPRQHSSSCCGSLAAPADLVLRRRQAATRHPPLSCHVPSSEPTATSCCAATMAGGGGDADVSFAVSGGADEACVLMRVRWVRRRVVEAAMRLSLALWIPSRTSTSWQPEQTQASFGVHDKPLALTLSDTTSTRGARGRNRVCRHQLAGIAGVDLGAGGSAGLAGRPAGPWRRRNQAGPPLAPVPAPPRH